MQHLHGLFGDFRSRGKPSECVKHDYATFQHESNNHLSSLVSVFFGGELIAGLKSSINSLFQDHPLSLQVDLAFLKSASHPFHVAIYWIKPTPESKSVVEARNHQFMKQLGSQQCCSTLFVIFWSVYLVLTDVVKFCPKKCVKYKEAER